MEITKVVKPFIKGGDPILLAILCIYQKHLFEKEISYDNVKVIFDQFDAKINLTENKQFSGNL